MKNILFLLVVLFSGFQISGQSYSGIIYTSDDQLPAPFTTLFIENSGLGTVADQNGEFKIDIPSHLKNNTISISFIGYQTQLISIDSLKLDQANVFYLEKDITGLKEIVLTSKKRTYKPLQLLKKSLNHIEKNYHTDTISFDGYYREIVSENGKCIKYADAICEFNYAPYRAKKFKRKEYFNTWISTSLSDISPDWGERFHRGHYPSSTLKGDQLHIVASRSSDNLSDKGQKANVEGGPLGLLGKDRVKFRNLFTKKGNFKNYEYTLSEKLDSVNNVWDYVVSFYPNKYKSDVKNKKKQRFKWYKDNVSGHITIDRNTLAIKGIEYSVPKELRSHICGFKSMNLKHLDYRVKSEYRFKDGKYYISYIQLQDEFVFTDTITQTRTAYNSTSELRLYTINAKELNNIKPDDLFVNTDANQVYDFAVDYDSLLWNTYTSNHPEYAIPPSIRHQMEGKNTLEKQFIEKHKRDTSMLAPIAKEVDYTYKKHGIKVKDEYAWLKDVKDPKHNVDVMDYINQENTYFDNYFTPLRSHQRNLFKELKAYQPKSETSLVVKDNGYEYYSKYFEDHLYPIYYRRKIGEDKEEELLNVEKLASNKKYYSAGVLGISPNNTILAYYENTTGKDEYVVKFKNLLTQDILSDSLRGVGSIEWVSDSVFLYSVQDSKTYRTYAIKSHQLFEPSSKDKLIYEELDETFDCGISKSKSKTFIYITCNSSTTSEQFYIRTNDKTLTPHCIYPRKEGHKYYVSHINHQFYILTNNQAINNKIVKVDTSNYAQKNWEEVIPHQEHVILTTFKVFKNYLVFGVNTKAQGHLMIKNLESNKTHQIKINENFHSVYISSNPDYDTDSLQFGYTSFETPAETIMYNMKTKESRIVKKQKIGQKYFGQLKVKRIWAKAKDGTEIPITLVYDKYNYHRNGWSNRMLLTSYGAYGSSQNVAYNSSLFPLLRRGFVYAMAHVRGGRDLGQKWYEEGKMLNKMNTFTDFIDCAEFLIEEGYTNKGDITIEGGSAGGLLMGAVANMRPDLFKAVVLNVPFVDVVNTMLDDKLPLTTGEYLEWGNPNNKTYFNYIYSYSPYDNVKAQDYPSMFFFTGLNDTRVGYWEPAKMVARLRKMKTNDQILLLKTNLHAGHGGDSGRYAYFKDTAMKYVLLFELYKKDELVKAKQ